MFLLGLLLPIVYVPAITGGAMATQWALLSLALPVVLWSRPPEPTTGLHILGLCFLAWVLLSITWSPQPLDAVYGAWVAILWGLSFQLGYTTTNPVPLYRGLAYGLYINVAIACAQWLGYHPFPVFSEGTPQSNIAGLLYNRTVFGAACALVALALIQHRRWAYAIPLLFGIFLSGSRGAVLAVIFALIANRSRLVGVALLAAAAALALYFDTTSDHERLIAWGIIGRNLTLSGWGPWSTTYLLMLLPDHNVLISAAHNDYLQLVFEFGLAATLPISILAVASRTPTVLGYACLACFWFPTYTPVTAFVGLFALGRSVRELGLGWSLFNQCGLNLHASSTDSVSGTIQSSGNDLPILSRT
jgi:hypothetical protein